MRSIQFYVNNLVTSVRSKMVEENDENRKQSSSNGITWCVMIDQSLACNITTLNGNLGTIIYSSTIRLKNKQTHYVNITNSLWMEYLKTLETCICFTLDFSYFILTEHFKHIFLMYSTPFEKKQNLFIKIINLQCFSFSLKLKRKRDNVVFVN